MTSRCLAKNKDRNQLKIPLNIDAMLFMLSELNNELLQGNVTGSVSSIHKVEC